MTTGGATSQRAERRGRTSRGRLIRLFRPRASRPSPVSSVVSYGVIALVAFICVAPFFYVLSAAFKNSELLFHYPPQWIPRVLYWGNFANLIQNTDFPRWVLNTLIVAGSVMVLKVLFDSMAGYAFAKLDFPLKGPLFIMFVAAMMVPFSAILIPLYIVVGDLGLLNSYAALILPPLAEPIGIFMMRQFILGVPKDLENAARLDGVSEFGIYWRIVLPLVKPGLVVLAALTFLAQYTSFLWPLVAVSDPSMQLITVGLASERSPTQVDYGVFSAGAIMAMIPITIIFVLLQRYFIAGSLAGALKE